LGEAKETAQIGAALGREFSYELLAAVSSLEDAALRNALDQLQRAELIFRRGLPPQAIYTFKHALVRDAAYDTLLKIPRRQLHLRIARVLKEHFNDRATAQPELLAYHYTEAAEIEPAIENWLAAGKRAAERSANVEAVAHLRHGLQLIESLPNSIETARLELALQSALGMPLIATKGYAAAETGKAYDRARELCDRAGTTEQLFPILYGQIVVHDSHADYRKGQQLSEEFLRLAENQSADDPALVARRMLGVSLFLGGEVEAGRKNIEQALALYDPSRHRALTFQYGADQRSAGLAWLALALFLLGYPTQAKRASQEAIALAQDIGHAITLAHALRIGGCFLGVAGRDICTAREQAAILKAYATQQRLPFWLAEAELISAWTSVESIPKLNSVSQARKALAELNVPGMGQDEPFLLAMFAEIYGRNGQAAAGLQVVDEALASIRVADEFWWAADIHRLKGQLLLSLSADNVSAAEACYEKAIRVAQRQCAKSLELRATINLAQLWSEQGMGVKARLLLESLYDWFGEGFDTPDLQHAKALLDQLGR
jgi:predicted ATPase